jgi:hypothetical protein
MLLVRHRGLLERFRAGWNTRRPGNRAKADSATQGRTRRFDAATDAAAETEADVQDESKGEAAAD